MKKFIIWFLCAIMLMIGIVGFVLVTNKETSNIVYYIANILKLAITVPAIMWWYEKIERILSK